MKRDVEFSCIEPLKATKNPVIVYSLTEEAEAIANACRDNGISVTAFCDNEIRKTKNPHCNLEVIYTPDLPKRFPKASFVLGHHTLGDCAEQLSDLGYNEFYSPLELLKSYNVDKHSHRSSNSYMKKKIANAIKLNELYFDDSKTYLRSLDIVITTKCSMNCLSCANLMQYYKSQKNTDEEILKAVKLISDNVDHISEYRVIGGEPLMNKKWAEITNSIIDQDPRRTVYIYSNATICPKDEQLESFQGKNIHFYLTDYDHLSRNMEKVVKTLKKHGIGFYRKPAGNWVDCSTIRKHNRSTPRLRQVFKECCAKELYTLLSGKLFTCPFIANAENINAIPDNKADYVDLFSGGDLKNKIRKLVKMQQFFPACDFCDGRPHDPAKALEYAGKGLIKAGKQIPNSSSLPYKEYK
tara:strand:- start:5928 stop:7160 length:1233 start_codon:yes stop_codon:yes gene_type:complete